MGLIDRVTHLAQDRTGTDRRRLFGGSLTLLLAALGLAPRTEPAAADGRRHGRNRGHHPGKHKDNRKGKRRDGDTLGSPQCGQLSRYGCTNSGFVGTGWQCPEGVNLSNANLSMCDLSNASLVKANLTGANLQFASLRKANLTGATITGNLLSTQLIEAVLVGAQFAPRITGDSAQLRSSDFTHATVNVKDWTGVICADGFQARKGNSCCDHFLAGKGPDSCSV